MVYESLAMKYRKINQEICEASGQAMKVVHIVGGGSRNDMLNQFTANALGLPVIAGPVEATAAGNIMVQAMALNIVKSLHDTMPIIKQAFPIRKYEPQDTELWNKTYERFKKMIA